MAYTATSTLILGQPGTGKSYFAKSVANNSSLPVYIINGQEKDYNTSDRFNHITFEDLIEEEDEINNCILIIDDVVRPSDHEAKCINKQLVHRKRHENITTFCIAHGIEKNNLNSLIKHFDYIMFPHDKINRSIFIQYAKKYSNKDKVEYEPKWDDFIRHYPDKLYLRHNIAQHQFEIIDSKGNPITNKDNKLRKKVFTYLSALGDTRLSMAFFDYLMDVLPSGIISNDLYIPVKMKHTRKRKKISIIDVCFLVTTKKENILIPPRKEIISFFKDLQDDYNIPTAFIGNYYFS